MVKKKRARKRERNFACTKSGERKKKHTRACTNWQCPINLLNKKKSHAIIGQPLSIKVRLQEVKRHHLQFQGNSEIAHIVSGEYVTHHDIISWGAAVSYKSVTISTESRKFTHIALFLRPNKHSSRNIEMFNDLSSNKHQTCWQLALTSGLGLANLPQGIVLMGPTSHKNMVNIQTSPDSGRWCLPTDENIMLPANLPLSRFENSSRFLECSVEALHTEPKTESTNIAVQVRNELAREHAASIATIAKNHRAVREWSKGNVCGYTKLAICRAVTPRSCDLYWRKPRASKSFLLNFRLRQSLTRLELQLLASNALGYKTTDTAVCVSATTSTKEAEETIHDRRTGPAFYDNRSVPMLNGLVPTTIHESVQI